MSVVIKIPDNSRVRYPVVEFDSAALSGMAEYDFGVAANLDKLLMDNVNAGSLYLISTISFFASAVEGDWLKSMKSAADFPRVTVRTSGVGGRSIFADPFRCVNYVDNCDQVIWILPPQKDVQILASMYGLINQVPGMVGSLSIRAQINFTVYEITDSQWIKTFRENPGRIGATVRL